MHLHRITIQNFKAFKESETIDLEGKSALICGNNGSGKSSLYYALHVFLQSSLPGKDITRYFVKHGENGSNESLLNLYSDSVALPYILELQLKTVTGDFVKYQIKEILDADALPSTSDNIVFADYASDFISHRLLSNFYNFRNSQSADIWSLFENEVLPYWRDDERDITLTKWKQDIELEFKTLSEVRERNAETSVNERKYRRESPEYKAIIDKVIAFNTKFTEIFMSLLPGVNGVLKQFLPEENIEVDIRYWEAWDSDITYEWLWNRPSLILLLKVNGILIPRPHTFLNEARLTALALSIRLAMFDKKFKGTGAGDVLKLLLLDDLLVSLDMSFRMKLVKYLQTTDTFKGYQIIMFTHDKGLFEILKQTLAEDENKWKSFEFFETNTYPIIDPNDYKNPLIVEKKDALVLAEEYLKGKSKAKNGKIEDIPKDYELTALYLRRKTEQLIKRFYDPDMEGLFRYRILKDLSNGIAGMETEYVHQIYSKIEAILSNGEIDEAKIKKLVDLNFDNTGLTVPEIQANNQLNSLKNKLLDIVKHYYKHDTNFLKQKKELIRLSKEMNLLRSRIMNKGAHHDVSPIFELELRGAIDKLKEFENIILKIK